MKALSKCWNALWCLACVAFSLSACSDAMRDEQIKQREALMRAYQVCRYEAVKIAPDKSERYDSIYEACAALVK